VANYRFCLDCLERALAVKAECPLDRSPASIDECSPAGRIINNMLNELKVHCEHRDKGCKAVVERQTLEGHLANVCEYHPIPCGHDPCSATVVRTDKAKHEADCQYRPEACALCSAMVPKCQMEVNSPLFLQIFKFSAAATHPRRMSLGYNNVRSMRGAVCPVRAR